MFFPPRAGFPQGWQHPQPSREAETKQQRKLGEDREASAQIGQESFGRDSYETFDEKGSEQNASGGCFQDGHGLLAAGFKMRANMSGDFDEGSDLRRQGVTEKTGGQTFSDVTSFEDGG